MGDKTPPRKDSFSSSRRGSLLATSEIELQIREVAKIYEAPDFMEVLNKGREVAVNLAYLYHKTEEVGG